MTRHQASGAGAGTAGEAGTAEEAGGEEAGGEGAAAVEIQVNGDRRRCAAGQTLVQVLESLGYRPQLVVVEFNGEILPRQHWSAQAVVESDVLEIVTIVGGGS
jgi:sulfur carrier protein